MSSNFLKKILSFDSDLLELAFGENGLSLLKFAKEVDPDHPDLEDAFSSQLLSEYLDLVNHLKKNKNNLILDLLNKRCFDFFSKILQEAISPSLNFRNLRFSSKSKIYNLRRQKKEQIICSKNFYEFASKCWQTCPIDFSLYSNKNKLYNEEIIIQKEKSKVFKNLGCSQLASSIEEKVKFFHEYHGYKKISILYACLILSKLNKCNLLKNENKDSIITINYKNFSYVAQYKIRSIFSLKSIPIKIKNIIKKLDNHREANFKPIFDNFLLLSPCLGKKISTSNKQHRKFKSIILGEKGKDYYFICEWH